MNNALTVCRTPVVPVEREERPLGKLQHRWEGINLHPAGVGHFLLPTINANFYV
jgi:hypothetical protein